MSHQIHLNHACDVTPPQSTVVGVVVLVGKFSGLHLYWDYLDDTPIKLGSSHVMAKKPYRAGC